MKKSYQVGLIASPELAENLANKIVDKLPTYLTHHISDQVKWQVEYDVDPMTGAAETIEELFIKAGNLKKAYEWDYIVCLTDLPIFHEKYALASDVNKDKDVILISLPAFGWGSLVNKVNRTIIYTLNDLENQQGHLKMNPKSNLIWREFPISPVKRINVTLKETNNNHIRYLIYPKYNGLFRLLLGMTYANNPLRMMSSLTGVVAIAFTTGGFGLVFTTMWKLSHLFSNWRLSAITAAAIIGMSAWVIIAHELWEPIKTSTHKRISRLYNLTTLSTLLIAVSVYYIVVFILFLMTSSILIPPGLLGDTLELSSAATFINYVKIAWFAASLSTITGAIGVGLESESVVRESTYGYRQRNRYKQVLKDEAKKDKQDS